MITIHLTNGATVGIVATEIAALEELNPPDNGAQCIIHMKGHGGRFLSKDDPRAVMQTYHRELIHGVIASHPELLRGYHNNPTVANAVKESVHFGHSEVDLLRLLAIRLIGQNGQLMATVSEYANRFGPLKPGQN